MAIAPVALTTLCTPRSGRWTLAEPPSCRPRRRSTAKENEPSWDSQVDGPARRRPPRGRSVVAPCRAARSAHTASSAHSTLRPVDVGDVACRSSAAGRRTSWLVVERSPAPR